jgi:arylsulfatase A-like enzyme
LIDLMPTVVDILGVTIEEPIDGKSLVPVMDGIESDDRIAFASLVKDGPRRVAVRGAGFKFIETIGPGRSGYPLTPPPTPRQLYDLTADPRESENLAASRPEILEAMREMLVLKKSSYEISSDPARPLDAHGLRERLRSLGYSE